jgi:hypothetical protein
METLSLLKQTRRVVSEITLLGQVRTNELAEPETWTETELRRWLRNVSTA